MSGLYWAINGRLERAQRSDRLITPGRGLRASRLEGSITPTAPPTPFPGYGAFGTYKPGEATSGLRPNTTLTAVYPTNRIYVMKPGETLENLDIHGVVNANVPNATIRNCRIRGRNSPQGGDQLINCFGVNAKNVLIEDCELIPDRQYCYVLQTNGLYYGPDGVKGHDFTARRNKIKGCVDGFGVFNTYDPSGSVNVTIEGNFVSEHTVFGPDGHSDGRSHNDGVQVQGGKDIVIRGNTFDNIVGEAWSLPETYNNRAYRWTRYPDIFLGTSAILLKGDVGQVGRVAIERNWMNGGGVTMRASGTNFSSDVGSLRFNRFGRIWGQGDKLGLINPVTMIIEGNVFDDDGSPAPIYQGP